MHFNPKIIFKLLFSSLMLGLCFMSANAQEQPKIKLSTSQGDIVLQLDPARAPISVANFISYVRDKHYDGTIFHRVIPGFLIQGGGYTPEMRQKPTRDPISLEANNGLKNDRYTIAMARLPSNASSATAQFFINAVNNNNLNSNGVDGQGYAVFGQVIEGTDVVDRMQGISTGQVGGHKNVPIEPVIITSATIINDVNAEPQMQGGNNAGSGATQAVNSRHAGHSNRVLAESRQNLPQKDQRSALGKGLQAYLTTFQYSTRAMAWYALANSPSQAEEQFQSGYFGKECYTSRADACKTPVRGATISCGPGFGAVVTQIDGQARHLVGAVCNFPSVAEAVSGAIEACRARDAKCARHDPKDNLRLRIQRFAISSPHEGTPRESQYPGEIFNDTVECTIGSFASYGNTFFPPDLGAKAGCDKDPRIVQNLNKVGMQFQWTVPGSGR